MSKGRGIREAAVALGVEPRYIDAEGRRVEASSDSLAAAVEALGPGPEPRPMPPVLVAWDGRGRFEWQGRDTRLECAIELEDGDEISWRDDGQRVLPRVLPAGRHRIHVRGRSGRAVAVVLSAPSRLPTPEGRELGLFIPLYALASKHSPAAGDLRTLAGLAHWGKEVGAGVTGTLPLLASYLDTPFEPSPYAPVSRLFWNEFYLHVPGVPRSGAADEVDYRGLMAAKRRVLERMAAQAWGRVAALEAFMAERPGVRDYASFRAETESRRATWDSWPVRSRDGRLPQRDSEAERYHIYVQYLLDRQLRGLAGRTRLYLDLPIGVHARGYDVWRHRAAFVLGASVGAPPDALFRGGQNWGFPPPHPQRTREDGHGYFAACLRNHFRYASILRIDHVMGLHRLFWIPRGVENRDGVYIRYPADELYATLSIEAHRAGAVVVGENLGTVPPEVNRTLDRRGVLRMFVGQFAMRADSKRPMEAAPAGHLASLNTHDMPTFAGFVGGAEIKLRQRLGLLAAGPARAEARGRATLRRALLTYARGRVGRGTGVNPVAHALHALLLDLAESKAEIVLLNLEDLWLEENPQNIPGIADEYPNWRRRAAMTLEEITSDRRMAALVRSLARARARRTGTRRRPVTA